MFFNRLANLLLASFAILVAIGIAELFCRIALPPPNFVPFESSYVPGLFVEHPIRGYAYAQKFRGQQTSPDYDVTFRINALGLRETDISPAIGGQKRILAVGDSFTDGMGVSFEDAWPNQLEQVLQRSWENAAVRVINAGTDGYGLRQIRLLTQELLPILKSDLLIVGLYVGGYNRMWDPYVLVGDHLVRSHVAERVVLGDGGFYHFNTNGPLVRKADLWLSQNIFVGARVLQGLIAVRRSLNSSANEPLTVEAKMDRLTPMLDELLLLKQYTESRGAGIVVLLIGGQQSDHRFDDDTMLRHGFVREFCVEQDIPVVETIPAFVAAANKGEKLRFQGDTHWNARGHRIAAELLSRSSALEAFRLQTL